MEESLLRRSEFDARVIGVGRAELVAVAAVAPRQQADLTTDASAEWPAVLADESAIKWFRPDGQSTEVSPVKLLIQERNAATFTTRNANTLDKVLRLLTWAGK